MLLPPIFAIITAATHRQMVAYTLCTARVPGALQVTAERLGEPFSLTPVLPALSAGKAVALTFLLNTGRDFIWGECHSLV